ncbi:S8 family serine peptidase [Flavobacterium sp. CYK-4]|uniref:S8 family serine peptidase n=1 Tax=Flavobacterium lotistagni TaxID=2709660 RepID=UPI00140DC9E8|nr:S8 family serine peptidase [Flavobacterium lotistagni]NHM07916.1 S8 family serine peptidase [Flavobacterium lotistagni]
MKSTKFLWVFIFFTSITLAQTAAEKQSIIAATNVKELNKLAPIYDSIFKAQKAAAWKMAAEKNWKTKWTTPNGGLTELIRLDEANNPIYFTTDNAGAAITTRANKLNSGGSLGLSLDGQNMTIGIWDGGKVRDTHNLLVGRVTFGDGANVLSAHATHVSGTMMGNATANAAAKGMASEASLRAYDWDNDVYEVTNAAANGLLISNHSYGYDPDNVSLANWGRYDSDARAFDNVMFNAPYYQFVNSAGNSRNGGYNQDKQGYDLLAGKSVSKNAIIVAAVSQVNNYISPSSVSMSGFSSWGPTDDGRIKPDICGKGVNVRSSTSNSNNSYGTMSGTSMASPNVAGTLLLLQQHHKNVRGGFMRAATLRGLAIHTADEAGTDNGPDYRFGWGLLNAERAANLITNEGSQAYIQENTLLQGKSYSFDIQPLNPNQSIMATICWTDPAGQIISGAIDLATPNLVNDLDIRITKNNQTFYPWKLDPSDVEAAATQADNKVDNVEKIDLPNAVGNYTVTVSHKGNLTNTLQNYSLIISGVSAKPMLLTSDSSLLNRNCQGTDQTVFTYQLKTPAAFSESVSFGLIGLPAGASANFDADNITNGGTGSVTISGLSNTAPGNYTMTLTATSSSYNSSLTLTLVVQNDLVNGPTLNQPANNISIDYTNPTLTWQNIGVNAASYTVEIAKNENFTADFETFTVVTNEIDLSDLDFGSDYFWRVRSNNVCGLSNYSDTYKFTTLCSNATLISLSNITINGALATWSNPNGSSSFEVAVVPHGNLPTGAFLTVDTNSYTITGLNSYSSYDVYVRASCSNNTFSALASTEFSTLINHCIDGVFFDSGGLDSNYGNSEYTITTITPTHPGEKATVVFTSFELEDQIDRLTIFNGPDTTYPFIGEEYGFTGTNSPGTVTSTDPSGKLTFRFYSDGATTASGWTANVSCAALSVSDFEKNQLQCYPNPAKSVVNFRCPEHIKSISVYTMLGQLIKTETPNTNRFVFDIATLSNGQYLFKVETTTSLSTVKILKN